MAQSVWGQLLDAVVLGVIFARISHPKQRARTIFVSDSAVIARRDGQLKFMFRIGDIRRTTVLLLQLASLPSASNCKSHPFSVCKSASRKLIERARGCSTPSEASLGTA